MLIKSLLLRQNPRFGNAKRASLSICIVFLVSSYSADVYSVNNEISENNAPAAESPISINYFNGRLSVSANQTPIVQLLQYVGNEVGFAVSAYGDFTEQSVSTSFSDLPLADAIRRLLLDTSAIVSYGNSGDSGTQPTINKIFLLGTGSAKVSPIRINTLESGLENDLRSSEIQSSDSESRIASIDRAEGLTDEITLENLAFSLQHDPDPGVRIKAISAIEKIGGSTAAEALESGLGDEHVQVRKKLVQTLGNIDDERIPLWLGQILMGDPSAEVRLVAVQSLALKEGDTARIFLEAAAGDSSSLVSEAALQLTR